MDNLFVCECNNNTWLVNTKGIRCSLCGKPKGNVNINPRNNQIEIINTMGISVTHPNAIKLAQARLDQLGKKEQIFEKIKNLIERE